MHHSILHFVIADRKINMRDHAHGFVSDTDGHLLYYGDHQMPKTVDLCLAIAGPRVCCVVIPEI